MHFGCRIDRYVLGMFIKNYLIAFMVLVGLYVVLDMVIAFDEFTQIKEKVGETGGVASSLGIVRDIADYYFYQMALFFVHLSGVIPVVAASFTLIRLTRFNELTAILAAGVPLLRIAAPIILAAFVLSALVLLDQELIIPRIIPKLTRSHDEVRMAGAKTFQIRTMRDDHGNLLVAARFTPPTPDSPARMEEVDIIEKDDQLRPIAHTRASGAVWDESQRRWNLTDGRRADLGSAAAVQETPVAFYQSSITPEEILLYRSSDYVELLSTERLDQLVQRPQAYGTADLLRVKHFRFAQPFINVVLLLLAIPFVMHREPTQLKNRLIACAIVSTLCMAAVFLTQQFAGQPPAGARWVNLWPVLMAWTPIFMFAPLAVYLLDRIET
jgi:lipopolysaccharide export system permease protein